jgi:4a-hydroxytetrahydrobiopterin dehydratase
MAALNKAEIQARLAGMPGWSFEDNSIRRKFTHDSFLPALAFVNRVADCAERAGHHPDIDIRYNQVLISTWTHSEGGVTEKDFQLAREIDRLS